MIGDYLNQSVTHRAADGTYTSEGQPNYDENTISVRWESKRQLVRNQAGAEVVSEALVLTETAVSVDDELSLDGSSFHRVISSSPITDLEGATVHYELRL